MPEPERITSLAYLEELSKGNRQFVTDMIRIFLEENPLEVETLQNGIRDRDFAAIRASAHKMRSTIPFVGIDALIEHEVSEIERLATEHGAPIKELADDPKKSGDSKAQAMEQIERLFARVEQVCAQACRELSARNAA